MRNVSMRWLSILAIVFLFVSCNQEKAVRIGISIGPDHERWFKDAELLEQELEMKGATVFVEMAAGVDTVQEAQVRNLIKKGIDVLVIAPIHSEKAANCVKKAKSKGIKVIAYDRIIKNCELDFYMSFDNVKVGEMQANYLTKIKPEGNYVILGGAPTDNNSALLRLGQFAVLQPLIQKGDITIVFDQYISQWDENVAFEELNLFLHKTKDIVAVVASSDALAKGAAKALAKHNLSDKVVVSGQDAQLDACKRIMDGKQTMTVYKIIKSLANSTASVAIALAKNEGVPNSYATTNNGQMMVPSLLLQSMIPVNSQNMRMTVVADGYIKEGDIFPQN